MNTYKHTKLITQFPIPEFAIIKTQTYENRLAASINQILQISNIVNKFQTLLATRLIRQRIDSQATERHTRCSV